MRVLEKSLIVLAGIGLFMKFNTTSGGDFIVLISLLLIAALYFGGGFVLFNGIRLRDLAKKGELEGIGALSMVQAIALGVVLSIICTGIVFKLLYITGAEDMLAVGSVALLIVTVYAVIKIFGGVNKNIYVNILWRSVPYAIIGLTLWLTPRIELIKLQYRDHPDFVQAYINYEKDPGNVELLNKLQKERLKTIDLKE